MANNEKAIKILLIDDEKSFCDIFSFALKKEGFNIEYFTDPKEALLNIVSKKPDLILLDIAMPIINGFSILSQLKKDLKEKQPKIVFLTNLKYSADGSLIDETYAKSLGADGIIHKTEDMDKVIEKIKEFLKNE